MIVIGSTYWNMVYGREIGDVLKDDEGIANMRNLGQNMALILSKLNYNILCRTFQLKSGL